MVRNCESCASLNNSIFKVSFLFFVHCCYENETLCYENSY